MVLLALPPADHLLIERDRVVLRLTTSSNFTVCWTGKSPGFSPSRAAYPQRRSSNASGLPGRNSARMLGIRASFQRDNLRRHFGLPKLTCEHRSKRRDTAATPITPPTRKGR